MDEIITTKVVEAQLPWYSYFKARSSWCDLISNSRGDQVVKKAKRVFAILGLYQHLPLERLNDKPYSNILCSRRGKECKEFKSFSIWKNIEVDYFLERQWFVLAPIFKTRGEHIPVEEKAPLPFYDVEEVSHSLTSTVYKGRLPTAYLMPTKNEPQIAIKCYALEKDFKREKDNLVKIQDLKHPHLIQHIATVQRGDLFYAILYWADGGNLSDFWERYPNAFQTRCPELFTWCLQQMLGLVEALFALHKVNCRHGDLKPENILCFLKSDDPKIPHSQYGTLVIADVGVSRVHRLATELRHDPTDTKATTPSYEAPEAETDRHKPRRRRYDMWSVGCIFMEFVIWWLDGYDAIGAFRELRKMNDNSFNQKAPYYQCTGNTAIIHPAVSTRLNELKNDTRCAKDPGLADLIKLIADDLIVIDPEKRPTAGKLSEKFKEIFRNVKKYPT
ncbi:hypothetical protein E0Z10_g906 [Xylaria hypoxylon]|uniref:Protein kinase domain-containing protein n=1 Tax=Xylaria hypoxylon TaxID=37992 RepID=A0A4Z0YV16_9PEZI|nr:hypothetical protein E0Z10_g906 [Xylaria hypoxylon]